MKKAIVKKEEPGGTTHAAFRYRLAIERQACAVRIVYRQKLKEIEKSYQDTLEPIDPDDGIKLSGMLLVIIDKIAIH